MTSSSEENLNNPATGPKVSSVAINYFVRTRNWGGRDTTYTFLSNVGEDCGVICCPLSPLSAN